MTDPESRPGQIAGLREAIAKVKLFLDGLGVEMPPNDLIITDITDLGDLWVFAWNNGWPFLEQRWFEYPGCDPLVVFKEDGRLMQIRRHYGWVEGEFDAALDDVRQRWRDSLGSA